MRGGHLAAQLCDEIGARRFDRRNESRQESGGRRRSDRERERAAVDPQIERERNRDRQADRLDDARRPPGEENASRRAERKEAVRRRGHLPRRRLLGAAHPRADPRGAAGLHRNPRVAGGELEPVRRLDRGSRAESVRRGFDPEAREEGARVRLDDEFPATEAVGRAEGDEYVLCPRVEGKQQEVAPRLPRSQDDLSERGERGDVEVVPE